MSEKKTDSTSPALDLGNAPAVRAYLADLGATLADLIATAEDATAPIALRKLGRLEHVRIIGEAKGALVALLAYAERGAAALEVLAEKKTT